MEKGWNLLAKSVMASVQCSLKRLCDRTYKVVWSNFISTNVSLWNIKWNLFGFLSIQMYIEGLLGILVGKYFPKNGGNKLKYNGKISDGFSSVWSAFVTGHIKWFDLSLFQLT